MAPCTKPNAVPRASKSPLSASRCCRKTLLGPTGETPASMFDIILWQAKDGIPICAVREISLLKGLDHPNVVKLLDVFSSTLVLYLIFECMQMDLRMFLKKRGQMEGNQLRQSWQHVKLACQVFMLGTDACETGREQWCRNILLERPISDQVKRMHGAGKPLPSASLGWSSATSAWSFIAT